MDSNKIIQDIIHQRGLTLAASGLDDEKAALEIARILKRVKSDGTTIVSLIGGAASGKGTLAKRVADLLPNTAIISTDDFLLGSREYRRKYIEQDAPLKKYDCDLLREKVNKIKNLPEGESEPMPVYDEKSGTAITIDFDPKTGQIVSIDKDHYPQRIGRVEFLIIEGDFPLLANPDYQIFFHVPDDARLHNRINRDTGQRAASIEETVNSYRLRQRLQHKRYTLPCAQNADLLITVDAMTTGAKYKYQYSFWISK
jgi:uridine kinase